MLKTAFVFLLLLASCSAGVVKIKIEGVDAQSGTAYVASQVKCPEGFYLKSRSVVRMWPYSDVYLFDFVCTQEEEGPEQW